VEHGRTRAVAHVDDGEATGGAAPVELESGFEMRGRWLRAGREKRIEARGVRPWVGRE
jgi:hypothetical protein